MILIKHDFGMIGRVAWSVPIAMVVTVLWRAAVWCFDWFAKRVMGSNAGKI
jgi:hypothetical protein